MRTSTAMALCTLLLLSALGSARAASCVETVRDAAICGADTVTDAARCGKETVTDAARCGTQTVTDAALCGTQTVTDAAVCGWAKITDAARCSLRCVQSPGPHCCELAATCTVPKRCEAPKRCEVARRCEVPRSCQRIKPECRLLPDDWKLDVLRNVEANFKGEIATLKARMAENVPKAARFATSADGVRLLAKVPALSASLAGERDVARRRFDALMKDPAKLEVVRRLLLALSRRQIDDAVRRDARTLDEWLVGDQRTRWAQVSRPSPLRRLADALLPSAHAAAHDYRDGVSFSVVVNLNGGGGIAGAYLGLGVVWDRTGRVGGILVAGALIGGIVDFGGDLTYRVHPSDLGGITGAGMGLTGSGTYYAGANAVLEWSAPYTQAVPTWGYGVSAGVGVQVTWSPGATVVFPILQRLVSQNGQCLDVSEPDFVAKRNGGKIQAWACNGQQQQLFRLEDGQLRTANDMCLDIDGNDYDAGRAGGKVQLWACHGGDNQKWSVNKGRLRTKNGKCLDLSGADFASKVNGGKVQVWDCHDQGPEQWTLTQ